MRAPLPDFKVRLPQELKDRIAEAARENNRSMNVEIVAALERAFPSEGGPTVEDLEKRLKKLEGTVECIAAWVNFIDFREE